MRYKHKCLNWKKIICKMKMYARMSKQKLNTNINGSIEKKMYRKMNIHT